MPSSKSNTPEPNCNNPLTAQILLKKSLICDLVRRPSYGKCKRKSHLMLYIISKL